MPPKRPQVISKAAAARLALKVGREADGLGDK